MTWDDEAERLLDMFCGMVPETYRELARVSARDEAELVASQHGANDVSQQDVVRGWIRTTPPDQRNSLVAVIEQCGFEPADFADELESAEGWDAEAEPEP